MSKERPLSGKITVPSAYADEGGTLIPVNKPETAEWKGRQVTVSEGHARSKDGRYHAGGPFSTSLARANIGWRSVNLRQRKSGIDYVYNGPIVTMVPGDLGDGSQASTPDSTLNRLGAEAIAAVEPTNANAETGVSLGEIVRDRRVPVPGYSLWKDRTLRAKQAGSEFLNAQFGWLPLIRDMKNTAQSIRDGNTIIENYRSNSGTWVSRDFVFPDIESSSESVVGTGDVYGPRLPAFSSGQGTLHRKETSVTKRWFSGAFTYLAGGDRTTIAKCLGIGSEADKLFSLSLSPDVVWELTPWSWAADWFSNASSVVHNAQAFGLAGTVMKYGYMMSETITTITYYYTGSPIRGYPGMVPPPTTIEFISKQRTEANPFGFGVAWEGLSPTQLAISAALGLTKLRK